MDWLIISAYFAVMLAVGWRARGGSPDAYWIADRSYGTVPLAASLVATIFGASSTVGIIGLGYARGLTGAWWSLIGGIALVPFGLYLASRVRRLEVYTLPDILRDAYGERVAVPGAVFIVVAWCGVVAAQVVAAALVLTGVLSVPFQGALALVTVIFIVYTTWGGQLSVLRTDAWQLLLFAGGLAVMLGLVASAVAGSGLGDVVPPRHLDFPVSPGFDWFDLLLYYPLIVGLPYLVGPDIYSRVLCARDGTAARNAALTAAALVIPLSFLLAALGLLIRAHAPGLQPENALPAAIGLAPVGLKGLIVAGVLGAIMSSADTTLISAATILALNVVSPAGRRFGSRAAGHPGLGAAGQLRLTRALVVVVGAVAWAIAAFRGGIIESLLLAYTVFVGGVVLPTLASFWRRRLGINATGAMAAVLGGGGAALAIEVAGGSRYAALMPVLLSAVLLLGVSRAARLGDEATRSR